MSPLHSSLRVAVSLGLAVLASAPLAARAADLTMSATYYTFTPGPGGDPDFDHDYAANGVYAWGTWYDLVTPTLGPNGLPVYNTAQLGGPSYSDLDASGELTWWSPSMNSQVSYAGSGTIALPYNNGAFFPVGHNNDANGFMTAIFRATLVVPQAEQVTFTFGADDDAFLYLDGVNISQLGGIHGVSPAPVVTSTLAPGSYSLELFYADQHQTGAGLYFSVDTANVGVNPVPEPATTGLMLAGLAFGAVAARRVRRTA